MTYITNKSFMPSLEPSNFFLYIFTGLLDLLFPLSFTLQWSPENSPLRILDFWAGINDIDAEDYCDFFFR